MDTFRRRKNPTKNPKKKPKQKPKQKPEQKPKQKKNEMLETLLKFTANQKLEEDNIVYTSTEIDANYFLLFLTKKHKNECLIIDNVSSEIVSDDVITMYQITYDLDKNFISTIRMPFTFFGSVDLMLKAFYDRIFLCLKKKKFIILPLNLEFVSEKGDFRTFHANMLIFNPFNRTISHYEPHGRFFGGGFLQDINKYEKQVEDLLKEQILNVINENLNMFGESKQKFIYLNKKQVCPTGFLGFQTIENLSLPNDNGYCLSWSMFYADLMLSNPDKTHLQLTNFVNDTLESNPLKYKQFIKGFALNKNEELDKVMVYMKLNFTEEMEKMNLIEVNRLLLRRYTFTEIQKYV